LLKDFKTSFQKSMICNFEKTHFFRSQKKRYENNTSGFSNYPSTGTILAVAVPAIAGSIMPLL